MEETHKQNPRKYPQISLFMFFFFVCFLSFPKRRVAPVRFGYRDGFGGGTVRAVPVFRSGGSSREGIFLCFSTVEQRGRFRFGFLFLKNGLAVRLRTRLLGKRCYGSDRSAFQFRFGSCATLKKVLSELPSAGPMHCIL